MGDNIIIPKRLNVGFRNRKDTYTQKLAYVIYWDEKGKLHKEKSWDGWRDHSIPTEEFENEPTSGFVLNKKVGDYSSGWNHRKAYCRVYDPRGFEFEIGFENLLYILENANSIKGKGLEGEFVYGWSGSDLVLVPTDSPDYKSISTYNKMLHARKNVRIKDLKVGATYVTKLNGKVIYMGKFKYYEPCIAYVNRHTGESGYAHDSGSVHREDANTGGRLDYQSSGNFVEERHFFAALKDDGTPQSSMSADSKYDFCSCRTMQGWLIGCSDENSSPLYDELYSQLQYSKHISPVDMDKTKLVNITKDEFSDRIDNMQYNVYLYSDAGVGYRIEKYGVRGDSVLLYKVCGSQETYYTKKTYSDEAVEEDIRNRFETEVIPTKSWNSIKGNHTVYKVEALPVTKEELFERLKPCYKQIYLSNGMLYKELGKAE